MTVFAYVNVAQLQLDKDELYKTQSIQKVQHKADLKKMQLETKLKALTDSLEKTKAQLQSVLSASNMDQTALSEVINKTEVNFYVYLPHDLFLCSHS